MTSALLCPECDAPSPALESPAPTLHGVRAMTCPNCGALWEHVVAGVGTLSREVAILVLQWAAASFVALGRGGEALVCYFDAIAVASMPIVKLRAQARLAIDEARCIRKSLVRYRRLPSPPTAAIVAELAAATAQMTCAGICASVLWQVRPGPPIIRACRAAGASPVADGEERGR